jgi:large subunit ribosomal protein L10
MPADTIEPTEHKRATVRPDKAEAVAELAEAFRAASAAVLTEYRGLSVKQISELRRALGADTTYSVVKNTLTTIAARDAGLSGLEDLLSGPTAVAFVNGDPVEAAKGLRDFAKAHPVLVVKGGVMDGKPLTADEVRKLADLESREVLLGKLAGAMLASLSQAVYLLNAPLAQAARLAGALQQKATEDPSIIGGAGTPTPAAEQPEAPAAEQPEAVPVVEADDAAGAPAAADDAAGAPAAADDSAVSSEDSTVSSEDSTVSTVSTEDSTDSSTPA